MLCKPGSVKPHTKFKAEAYILTKEEGGRHTPFFTNYRPQFYFRTTDVTGVVTLPAGTEMVMPGDNIAMEVTLIVPIAMEEKLRFAIPRAAAPSAPASSPASSSERPLSCVCLAFCLHINRVCTGDLISRRSRAGRDFTTSTGFRRDADRVEAKARTVREKSRQIYEETFQVPMRHQRFCLYRGERLPN